MERKYKISIPEPCHENWDQMTPKANGRFCMSCSKTVIDFTTMLPEEIQHFFIQNQNEKNCGRFRKSQLDTIIIQIPDRVLYSQIHFHKIFLLALFVVMGTTLFSCQNNDGEKQKIDKIEIVKQHLLKNSNPSSNEDSIIKKPPAPPLYTKIEPIMIAESGGPDFTYSDNSYYETLTGTPAIQYIEAAPDYPGGFEKFSTFIKNEFQIPKKAKRITGKIEVSFVIEKTGFLNQIRVFDNIGHETGEEMVRVLQNSKKWRPGIVNDKTIPTPMRLNIILQRDSLNTERKKRKLSKIVSIDLVKNDNLMSQAN